MVARPQPNLCANTSRRRAILPANPPGRGLATALCFVIGRRNRYRGLHEQANPENSKTTPHIFGYRFFEVEASRQDRQGEDLGGAQISARRRRLSFQHLSAPDLSRAVDDQPQLIS